MVKLCAVKTCPSSRKVTKKRELSFFQPTTPTKLENWKKSLGFDLRKTDYICHLHFREEHVRMYDKVNIQGTMYYSYLHKKVLKEEALPTIDHQFHPPPQESITTQTKVKELLLKKQPCNNFDKIPKKVDLQNQVQIETSLSSGEDEHQSTASPGLLEERQADDCSINHTKPEDSFQEQIENQFEKSTLQNQREGKDQQQTLQLELATPGLVPYSNIGLQGLLVQQPDNNCTMYYIKTDGNFGMQIENQFSQSDLQQLSEGKDHQRSQIVQLAAPNQETYSINYIKIENTLHEQTKNQFAQNNLGEQKGGTECQEMQQIQLAIPKQAPHCNIELQGLSVDQQSNNCAVNDIKTQDNLLEQTENKFAQNYLKEQWKTMENQQTQQIQLGTSKQEPHYNIEIKMLPGDPQSNSFSVQTDGSFYDQTNNKFAQIDLDDQWKAMKYEQTPQIQLATSEPESHCNIELHRQANNRSMGYIKTGESFQEQIENKLVHNNLENLRVEEVQQQAQKPYQSFDCWKKKFTKLSVLPPYWLYIEKLEKLEFMRIDPTNMEVKNHLCLNEDLSITVIFLTKEEFLTKDKVSLDNFNSYLKSVEQWPICVGTQMKQKYSKKCKGVIIGDENHNSHRKDLRCKSCRILRNQLQRSILKKV